MSEIMNLIDNNLDWLRIKREFYKNNWSSSSKKVMLCIRVVTISCVIFSSIGNSIYGWAVQKESVDCVEDKVFDLTESINHYFNKNVELRSHLFIVCSILSDTLFFCYFSGLFFGEILVGP
jgi:hypothetical protein